jgi:hypothetical protein
MSGSTLAGRRRRRTRPFVQAVRNVVIQSENRIQHRHAGICVALRIQLEQLRLRQIHIGEAKVER